MYLLQMLPKRLVLGKLFLRLGQGTCPTGQAVRVMVWLGLESWSTRLNCSLGVITHGVSLGQVRAHVPLGRRLEVLFRVMVHTVKLFPQSHHTSSILKLGQVMVCGYTPRSECYCFPNGDGRLLLMSPLCKLHWSRLCCAATDWLELFPVHEAGNRELKY